MACSPPAQGPSTPDAKPVDEGGAVPAPDPAMEPPDPPQPEPTASAGHNPPVHICTEANCMNGLRIVLSPDLTEAGTYSITVAEGAQSSTCEVIFPYPACGTPATKCEGALPMMAVEEGCERPKDKQTFPKLGVGAAPGEVRVTVARDKKKLVEKTVKPAYEELRPNGPKCLPVCHFGTVEIPWKPPAGAKSK